MKNAKKILICCVCAVVVSAASVVGTMAYLTDRDSAVNTFTVGKVDITVDETAVDSEGKPVEGSDRVKTNEYHLLPGMTYTKDPAVTVEADSADTYVRMILTIHNASAVQDILTKYDLGDFSVLIGGWDRDTWLYQGYTGDTTANTISFEFRYKEVVSQSTTDARLPALFETLIVPGEITGDELQALYEGGFKMEVFGHAIQAAGMTTAELAWESFEQQINP